MNAADEIAVEAFLDERISFSGIALVIEETLAKIPLSEPDSLAGILAVDANARRVASEVINSRSVQFAPARTTAEELL